MASDRRPDYRRKIMRIDAVVAAVGPRPRAKKVIMCHGTFDVVHPGHIRHLQFAKSKADTLVASITADAQVAKSDFRPYVPEDLRALNLAALEMVDYVVIDRTPTPLENLARLQPDVFAKGYDYADGDHPRTREETALVESYGGEIIFTPGDVVYSSTTLIEHAPPDIAIDKLAILMENEKLAFADLTSALGHFAGVTVHVAGDTIVDSHTHGSVIGGATKAPTVSVRHEGRNDYAGGAAVVATHLAAAGARVVFSTVLGDDALKDFVLGDLGTAGIECHAVIDPTRPTTNKNVIIAGGYRLLKLDTVDNGPISGRVVRRLEDAIAQTPADAVVFADYRHGIFIRSTIPRFADAIPKGVFRVADSQVASRWGNILEFEGFDLITPNEREARFALGDQDSGVRPLGYELHRKTRCKTLILKLGERGLITFRGGKGDAHRSFFVIDSFTERLADAVGAGDALLAYATLAMIATGNAVLASILGSFAAAVKCESEGNVAVTAERVRERIAAVERRTNYGSSG